MMQNIHAHRGVAQISSKILFYSILILSSQRSMASEVSMILTQEVTSEVFGQISEALAPSLEVFSWIGVGVQVCHVGKDIKTYTFPNDKERARALAISEKLELVKSQKNFRYCLKKNSSNSKISSSGYPTICEEAAKMLEMCGGESELERMTLI